MIEINGFTYTSATQAADPVIRAIAEVDAYIVDVMHQLREAGRTDELREYAERLAQVRAAADGFHNQARWQRFVKEHGR